MTQYMFDMFYLLYIYVKLQLITFFWNTLYVALCYSLISPTCFSLNKRSPGRLNQEGTQHVYWHKYKSYKLEGKICIWTETIYFNLISISQIETLSTIFNYINIITSGSYILYTFVPVILWWWYVFMLIYSLFPSRLSPLENGLFESKHVEECKLQDSTQYISFVKKCN